MHCVPGQRFWSPTLQDVSTPADTALTAGRVAESKMKTIYRVGYDRSHAHHGKGPDLKIRANDTAGANRGPGTNADWERVFARIGTTELLQIRRAGARKTIVRKHSARTNHDPVIDQVPAAAEADRDG